MLRCNVEQTAFQKIHESPLPLQNAPAPGTFILPGIRARLWDAEC